MAAAIPRRASCRENTSGTSFYLLLHLDQQEKGLLLFLHRRCCFVSQPTTLNWSIQNNDPEKLDFPEESLCFQEILALDQALSRLFQHFHLWDESIL